MSVLKTIIHVGIVGEDTFLNIKYFQLLEKTEHLMFYFNHYNFNKMIVHVYLKKLITIICNVIITF